MLSACQYIRRGDFPADYPVIQGADPQTVLIRGGSVIVNPLGCVLAGPDYSGEKILTADLDPGEVAGGKFDLDVAGHYARRKGIKSCRGSADLSKSLQAVDERRCLGHLKGIGKVVYRTRSPPLTFD